MPTEKPCFHPSSVLHMKNLNKVSDVEPMSLVARQTKCTLKPVFGMGTKKKEKLLERRAELKLLFPIFLL